MAAANRNSLVSLTAADREEVRRLLPFESVEAASRYLAERRSPDERAMLVAAAELGLDVALVAGLLPPLLKWVQRKRGSPADLSLPEPRRGRSDQPQAWIRPNPVSLTLGADRLGPVADDLADLRTFTEFAFQAWARMAEIVQTAREMRQQLDQHEEMVALLQRWKHPPQAAAAVTAFAAKRRTEHAITPTELGCVFLLVGDTELEDVCNGPQANEKRLDARAQLLRRVERELVPMLERMRAHEHHPTT